MFNGFDIAVLTVILLSSLIALFRGMLRELLSLAAWIGASIITFMSYDQAGKAFSAYISHETVATAAGALATFIAGLIVLSIINVFILKAAKKVEIGPLDRSLGFAFGLLRGVFIVALAYMVFSTIMSNKEEPEWLANAKTGHLVEISANVLADIAPGLLDEIESITSAVKEKETGKQITHTKEPGFIESILIRQVFSALTGREKEAMREISKIIPAMQLPRPVPDASALSNKEAGNMLINMVRLYKQLARKNQVDKPEGEKPANISPETLASLEDKLMVIYMQARDTPSNDVGTAAEKTTQDGGYPAGQLQQMQKLLDGVNNKK